MKLINVNKGSRETPEQTASDLWSSRQEFYVGCTVQVQFKYRAEIWVCQMGCNMIVHLYIECLLYIAFVICPSSLYCSVKAWGIECPE